MIRKTTCSTVASALMLAIMSISFLGSQAQADAISWNTGTGVWDTSTSNWLPGPTTYTDGSQDDVTFDDVLGSPPATVTVQGGGVTPISTTVAGAGNYTFDAGGSILGGTLAKTGAGTLTINNGSNSFSSVDISGGIVTINDVNRLGSGTITFSDNAKLFYAPTGATAAFTNPILISNDKTATIELDTASGTWGIAGQISGGTLANPVALRLIELVTGAGNFDDVALTNASNNFVGSLEIAQRVEYEYQNVDGVFGAASNSISVTGNGVLDLNGFTLSRDVNGGNLRNGTVTGVVSGNIVPQSTLTLTNTSNSLSQVTLQQGGTLQLSDPDQTGGGAVFFFGSTGVGTLRTTGTPSGNWTDILRVESSLARFEVVEANAVIDWTGQVSTRSSGPADHLTKGGAGTLNLSDLSGILAVSPLELTVEAGTLNLNDSTPPADRIDGVNVESGATLGGTGLISLVSGTSVSVDGTIAPGMSAGQLSIGGSGDGLSLNAGGTYLWEITTLADDNTGTPGTEFDQLVISAGDVLIDPTANLQLSFGAGLGPDEGDIFWDANHTWTILDFSGPGSSNDTISSLINGSFGAGDFAVLNVGGSLQLSFTAMVPEPSGFLLLGLGAFGLIRHTRRRKQKS